MTNVMPLVHEARRARRNREAGNPFATDTKIRNLIDRLEAAYLACRNERVSRLLQAEIDLLGDLTCPAS
jgi:hypothetical protein